MRGKIIKGVAGSYLVHCEDNEVYECKARGVFRKKKEKPLVGDNVDVEILSAAEHLGTVVRIENRKNQLIRPAVANVDRAMVIFAVASPEPSFSLLDRFLWMMEREGVETGIVFNKADLLSGEALERLRSIYEPTGYPLLFTSAKTGEGLEQVKSFLKNNTTTVAGPSGVGKSSLINACQSTVTMETGDLSRKLERGKHTTRHSELIFVEENTYIMDTPGFSSLFVSEEEKNLVKNYFREFGPYEEGCRFPDCVHMEEPDCGVKRAVAEGKIHKSRYESYRAMFEEVKEKRKY